MPAISTLAAPAATAAEIVVAMEAVRQRIAREFALLGALALDLQALPLGEDAGEWATYTGSSIATVASDVRDLERTVHTLASDVARDARQQA